MPIPSLRPCCLRPFITGGALALLSLTAFAQGLPGLDATVVRTEQVRAELMAHAPEGAAAGAKVWLGLQLTHAPEWHTYWKNSGDSGMPTALQWTLPEGVSAGEIAWPTPRKFPIGPLANYGYNGTVLLPVPLKLGPGFKGQQLDVQLQASWLVCRKECIPQEGRFSLRLPAQVSTGLNGAAFDAALVTVPRDQAAGASTLQPQEQRLDVRLEGLPAAWRGKPLEFFPEPAGLIEPGAPWTQAWDGARWTAKLPLSAQRGDSPAQITLVVAQTGAPGEGPGLPGVRMTVPVRGAWPAAAALPAAVSPALQAALDANAAQARAAVPPPAGGASALTLGAALLGALIGGLILNLMPCVFPVLAIKVLAFARHADDRAAHRRAGLAYTAGVLLSFLALGGVLTGLRAAGEQLGWGFQLQSPLVVAALATLFTLIGLNLAGLFEVGHLLPGRLAGMQARNPTADALLTGVLAVAVASPCTAPFMGASLGLAATLPAAQALAVFAALGLGMALPYLVASLWPAVARALPRPGAWMERLRQFMAFPMFATVVWLLWVLGQQSGIDGAAALLMLLVVLALLAWTLGLRGRARLVLGGLSALALLWLGLGIGPHITRLQAATPATATEQDALWQPWSADKVAALQAQGRPVFVDFTAAWCVTCQFNKRNALSDAGLLAEMAQQDVALLRADWTRRDPAVTAALAELGRNGVPVYAVYRPGHPVRLLTEVLSVAEVRDALQGK